MLIERLQFVILLLEGAISCVQLCKCYNGGGIHFDDVASKLTCSRFIHSFFFLCYGTVIVY